MHTFFLGWRRKVGCLTLVMACVLSSLLVRSYFDHTEFDIVWWDNIYVVQSINGQIRWGPWAEQRDGSMNWEASISRSIPYWPVVLPLALLSAYLILLPRRKRPPIASLPHA